MAAQLFYMQVLGQVQARALAAVQKHLVPVADRLYPARRDALSSDWEDAFDAINAELDATLKSAIPLIGEAGDRVVGHSTRELQRTLSIDLRGTEKGLDPQVERFVRDNVQLVKSVQYDQLARMRELVSTYHAGQETAGTLADQLVATFKLSDARADLIARDQTLKLNANISQLRQQQVGVTQYYWTTAGDERVRGNPAGLYPNSSQDHWKLDGLLFSWSDPPIVDDRNGARAHPGVYFQCRCVAVPHVDALLKL